MKKKVIFTAALGLGLVLAPLGSVFAEETVLTVNVPESEVEAYELIIPAEQAISAFVNSKNIGYVAVTPAEGDTVFPEMGVSVSASHTSFETADETASFDFVLGATQSATSDWTGDTWTKEQAEAGKVVNHFVNIADAEWDKAISGDYTATITYTAAAVQ